MKAPRFPEIFYRQTVFRIARNWARVPGAPWEKVRDPLFNQCPHSANYEQFKGEFVLDSNGRASVVGLGLYFLESKGRHVDEIVPYILWVESKLLDVNFLERLPGTYGTYLYYFLDSFRVEIANIFFRFAHR